MTTLGCKCSHYPSTIEEKNNIQRLHVICLEYHNYYWSNQHLYPEVWLPGLLVRTHTVLPFDKEYVYNFSIVVEKPTSSQKCCFH